MIIFDKEALSYDSWYKTKIGSFVDQLQTTLAFNMLKPKKDMMVLDIGCGTGNFSIKLAEMGCKVIGIDVSDEMLNIAREKASNKKLDIEFYNMDVFKLKFDDDTFDAAISMAAFEFIKQPEKALEEIFRVVRKSGKIVIGTINKESKWGQLYLTDEFQQNTVYQYATFKTLEELKTYRPNQLKETGSCLFIPPSAMEEEFSIEVEEKLSTNERGGFICARWEK